MTQALIAVYPGTFDPLTLGHQDLLSRAARCVDQLIVAVAVAHHKTPWFSLQERIDMVKEAVSPWSHVKVLPLTGLLTEFCEQQGAQLVLRGIRNMGDFESESRLAHVNTMMRPEHETWMMLAHPLLKEVSSTVIREVALLQGPLNKMVNPEVEQRLRARVAQGF